MSNFFAYCLDAVHVAPTVWNWNAAITHHNATPVVVVGPGYAYLSSSSSWTSASVLVYSRSCRPLRHLPLTGTWSPLRPANRQIMGSILRFFRKPEHRDDLSIDSATSAGAGVCGCFDDYKRGKKSPRCFKSAFNDGYDDA